MTRVKRSKSRKIIKVLVFLVVFGAFFLGIQFFTKTGLFKKPGVVYYDESLSEAELEALSTIFTDDIRLKEDVYISARTEEKLGQLNDGEFVVDVLVPVSDFYDSRTDTSEYAEDEIKYITLDNLNFTSKLLSLNGYYYLDEFDMGAKFRIISFESDKYAEEIQPMVEAIFTKTYPNKDTVLTFAQTGVTALSRGMNAKLLTVNNAIYFTENIGNFLSSFDLTHTSNESSFSNYANANNICSNPQFIDTLIAIGLDIVELTGNHNQDCGDQAALDTIDVYNERGIQIVGGGKTATEAATPLQINEKNSNITFLAYNLSTGGTTYDNTPGANQYYEENASTNITEAKERGDFVIVDIQYYECSGYDYVNENTICDYANSAAGDQIGLFRHLIDLGADLVVGTSAHQPQTFELYNNGAIYYGLGNLFFDQVWWPGTTRSLVLGHYFYNGKLLQTKIIPTVYDDSMQTKIMNKETSSWFINRLINARP